MSTLHPTGTSLLFLVSTFLAQPSAMNVALAAEIRRQSPTPGQRLLPGSAISFEVIRSESAEPVPLRSGPIFIPTRLFLTARSEAEFAVVLAHAIAHSVQSPGRSRLFFPLHDDAQYPIPRGRPAARQEEELAADRQALELSQSAGFPPAALAQYLRRVLPANDSRLANLPPPGNYIATPDERFFQIQALVKSLLPVRRPPTLHREPSAKLK